MQHSVKWYFNTLCWFFRPYHVCKYCGIKTKQPDTMCWNKPIQGKPKLKNRR